MSVQRRTSVRLVRNQSINLTTGVVTESDESNTWANGQPVESEVFTINDGIKARKAARSSRVEAMFDRNTPQAIFLALKIQHNA